MTIAAVAPQGAGNLRLSAAGQAPSGGVVNYNLLPLDNANTVIVPLGPGGAIDVFANAAATDVSLAALGYLDATPGLRYHRLTPCAVADSRPDQGSTAGYVGPFGPGDLPLTIDVVGSFDPAQGGGNSDCGVPPQAEAVMINLVAVGATGGPVT